MAKWIPGRRFVTSLTVLALAGVMAVATVPAALGALGRTMAFQPPFQRADVAAVTPESGISGELEAIDLLNANAVSRIVVLVPEPDAQVRELIRRGVQPDSPTRRLLALGAPADRVAAVSAGEGGTEAIAKRLADWPAAAPSGSLVVIVGTAHARRVGRVIARHWRGPGPPPAVRVTRYDSFRPDEWWRHRRSLRQGLTEIQKLALDYASHPLD